MARDRQDGTRRGHPRQSASHDDCARATRDVAVVIHLAAARERSLF
jgi:hypothetical protein